ncbi:uncharacterized protein EI90DRAFT_3061152 [Cantharellus anzutake]|uniref:uncharacterized protein n=1 Tax=Cantharellus anzutake TaxID=1750568 RepID=UPI001904F308|nr:uncharacterized protein EI90DRAFT_3061152 [Cantharellus anzutake]KAF8329983.1 hypothetical protein EI90DRAFT_3061152 [Cantharellus anzutake]
MNQGQIIHTSTENVAVHSLFVDCPYKSQLCRDSRTATCQRGRRPTTTTCGQGSTSRLRSVCSLPGQRLSLPSLPSLNLLLYSLKNPSAVRAVFVLMTWEEYDQREARDNYSSCSGPSAPKLRTSKTSSLRSQNTASTSVITLKEYETRLRSISDAVAQTPFLYDAPTPPTASFIGSKPPEEESHVQVDFSVYTNAIFGSNHRYPGLDTIADDIVRSDEFSRYRKTYLERYGAKKKAPLSPEVPDPDVDLMRLFNFVVWKAPSFGFSHQYAHDIHYGKRPEEPGTAQPKHRIPQPRCLGVECVAIKNKELGFEFSNSILSRSPPPVDYGFPRAECDTECMSRIPVEPRYDHSPGGTKRPRDFILMGSDATRQPSKRRKLRHLPPPVASSPLRPPNLIQYATEAICIPGNRRHVLGLHVEGGTLQFWYFDRAGSVSSTMLDLEKDEHQIVATLLHLSLASKACLGYESFFKLSSKRGGRREWWTAEGHEIEVGGEQYKLVDVIHLASSLYGRGTTVFGAQRLHGPENDLPIPDSVIVKCAWQPVSKHNEDELFRIAHARGVEGIARLYGSTIVGRLSEGTRGRLCNQRYFQDREFRIQVMGPRCMPLYKVKGLDHFKIAFTSLVQAHHDLYGKAGILHRDISINNLMVDLNDPTKGVLIDLDMAVRDKDPDTNTLLDVPPLPGATLPFRSVELCYPDPLPRTRYRHDLESFFFVLLWMALYRVGKSFDSHFGHWSAGTWSDIRATKRGFLMLPSITYFSDSMPLKMEWILPLWRSLAEGYEAKVVDEETLDNHVSYDVYMDILKSS